ncbi:MAG: hypothetical protein KJ630_19190 [Proteobacteria bacterium]|nr:hypothetical protein [Pseudomonadota bacterium]
MKTYSVPAIEVDEKVDYEVERYFAELPRPKSVKMVRKGGMHKKISQFDKGVLFAVSSMMNMSTDTTVAEDVLVDAGLTDVDVSLFEEYDKVQFRKFSGSTRVVFKGL